MCANPTTPNHNPNPTSHGFRAKCRCDSRGYGCMLTQPHLTTTLTLQVMDSEQSAGVIAEDMDVC